MAKERVRRNRYSPFEKLIYSIALIFMLVCPVAIIFSQAKLSNLNYDVENLKGKITAQKRTNESIQMMINELANLDRIEEMAKASGLNISNNNMLSINK